MAEEKLKDHVGTATYIESFYWTNDRYPTLDEVEKYTGWSQAQLDLISEPINTQLKQRGHPPFNFKIKKISKRRELDPNFVAACAVICDPLNKATPAAKLKLAGLSTREWQVMLGVKENADYFQKRMAKVFKGAEQSAQMTLVKNIDSGDLQSVKYYHEMTGIYRPNTETLLNLGVLLSQLMEILATYVPSNILLEVATKFEKVIEGHSTETPIKEVLTNNPLMPEKADLLTVGF